MSDEKANPVRTIMSKPAGKGAAQDEGSNAMNGNLDHRLRLLTDPAHQYRLMRYPRGYSLR